MCIWMRASRTGEAYQALCLNAGSHRQALATQRVESFLTLARPVVGCRLEGTLEDTGRRIEKESFSNSVEKNSGAELHRCKDKP